MASKAARTSKANKASRARKGIKIKSSKPATKSARPAKVSASKSGKSGKNSQARKPIRKPTRKPAPRVSLAAAVARYHTLTPVLNVRSAEQAINFYKQAFGAEERLRMPAPDGRIMHCELVIGDSCLMLADVIQQPESRASVHVYVDDCDDLYQRAIAAGGRSRMEPADMFWGDRFGQLEDPFGNLWSIATHKEDVGPDEMARRMAAQPPPPPPPGE
jgi:PhnB protein